MAGINLSDFPHPDSPTGACTKACATSHAFFFVYKGEKLCSSTPFIQLLDARPQGGDARFQRLSFFPQDLDLIFRHGSIALTLQCSGPEKEVASHSASLPVQMAPATAFPVILHLESAAPLSRRISLDQILSNGLLLLAMLMIMIYSFPFTCEPVFRMSRI
jgi:hypothetical protein